MMARKKKEIEEVSYPEFGIVVKDDDGVMLVLESNAGQDKHKYLEKAKNLERPILLSIESDVFDTYKFKNFALTRNEARTVLKELNRMLDYLED